LVPPIDVLMEKFCLAQVYMSTTAVFVDAKPG